MPIITLTRRLFHILFRSKSPAAAGSSVKNELKTEADNYYNNYDDDWGEEDVDLGYGVTSRDLVG